MRRKLLDLALALSLGIVPVLVVLAQGQEKRDWKKFVGQSLEELFAEVDGKNRAEVKEVVVAECFRQLHEGEREASVDDLLSLLVNRIAFRYELLGTRPVRTDGMLAGIEADVKSLCKISTDPKLISFALRRHAQALVLSEKRAEAKSLLRARIQTSPPAIAEPLAMQLVELLARDGELEEATSIVEPLQRSGDGGLAEKARDIYYTLTRLTPGKLLPKVRCATPKGGSIPLVAEESKRTLIAIVAPGCGPSSAIPNQVAILRKRIPNAELAIRIIVAGANIPDVEKSSKELGEVAADCPVIPTIVAQHLGEGSELAQTLCIRRFPTGFMVSSDGIIECSSFELRGWDRFYDAVCKNLGL